MCLGGGGGYEPPRMIQKPPPEPRPASPPDMINNQIVDNANPRDQIEGNQNALDPKPNKKKIQVQSDKNPGMM